MGHSFRLMFSCSVVPRTTVQAVVVDLWYQDQCLQLATLDLLHLLLELLLLLVVYLVPLLAPEFRLHLSAVPVVCISDI